MNNVKTSIYLAVMVLVIFVSGCSAPLTSALGLYPPTPGPVEIKGSNSQVTNSRQYPYTFDDVFQATQDVIFRKGLIIEEMNKPNGTIVGNGYYQTVCGSGPCKMNVTYIAYVKEVNDSPITQVTITLDRYTIVAMGAESTVITDLLIDIQKELATY